MSLLDDLANPPQKASTFREWLGAQKGDLRAALEAAALDPRWSNFGLERTLRKHGAPCSDQSIESWRRELGYAG